MESSRKFIFQKDNKIYLGNYQPRHVLQAILPHFFEIPLNFFIAIPPYLVYEKTNI